MIMYIPTQLFQQFLRYVKTEMIYTLLTLDSMVIVNTAWLLLLSRFIEVEATRLFSHPEFST